MAAGGVGELRAGEHSGDFFHALGLFHEAHAGLRATAMGGLFDEEVLVGERSDLRQVRDADDLLRGGEGLELLADGFCGAAADADVDFVED